MICQELGITFSSNSYLTIVIQILWILSNAKNRYQDVRYLKTKI